MIDKEFELDYGSTIDRTIPNGTIFHRLDCLEYIVQDGDLHFCDAVIEDSSIKVTNET